MVLRTGEPAPRCIPSASHLVLKVSATFLKRGIVCLSALCSSSRRQADEGEHMARPPLYARPPIDPAEERTLRRLASARHAPASLIQRARIITASWDGASVAELAQRLGRHPKTVYKWLHRFNTGGIDGLADLPRPGVPRRTSEHQRGRIIALARSQPPGRLHQGGEGLQAPEVPEAPATWTLDTLAQAARAEGIAVGRSQVRRILQ